jgi:hypothetical protein
LGAADGLTIVIALAFGHDPAVFKSALDAGLGELCGMTAAVWLSTRNAKFVPAFLCGVATLLGCVLPAIPYALGTTDIYRGLSVVIAIILGAIVCKLRPEKGWLAVTETYGVLLASALLCFAVSFL